MLKRPAAFYAAAALEDGYFSTEDLYDWDQKVDLRPVRVDRGQVSTFGYWGDSTGEDPSNPSPPNDKLLKPIQELPSAGVTKTSATILEDAIFVWPTQRLVQQVLMDAKEMQALTQLKAVLNYFGDRLSLTPKERSAFNRLMNLNSNPNREAGDLKVQILKMCKTLGLDT